MKISLTTGCRVFLEYLLGGFRHPFVASKLCEDKFVDVYRRL